jgi:ABC-type phosphate transport system substrate-binding protein
MFKSLLAIGLVAAASFAHADVVVIGNPAAAALTKDQVSDVFLGKSQVFTPIDQPDSAAVRAEFYKKATGRDPAQVKATWSRLVFTGKAVAPKEVADAAAVKKAVAADPKAIGYIDKSAVDGSVKVLLALD